MKVNREAQRRYKLQYDKTARTSKFRVGDWVMIYFLQDKNWQVSRKLSHPWHGPYQIISKNDPTIIIAKSAFQMIHQYMFTSPESRIVSLHFLQNSIDMGLN